MQKSPAMMISGAIILVAASVQMVAIQLRHLSGPSYFFWLCGIWATALSGLFLLVAGWWKRD